MLLNTVQQRLMMLVLSCAVLITAGCGFNLRGVTQIPQELRFLELNSNDLYGPITRAIYKELKQNGVTIIEGTADQSIPSLRIINSNESRETVSIFQDGKTAEYQLIMIIDGQILLPDKDIYSFRSKVFRTFFDNPLTALAKDAEQDIIRQEMREQLAQQVIRKLLTVKNEIANGKILIKNIPHDPSDPSDPSDNTSSAKE